VNRWKVATFVLIGVCGLEAWKIHEADETLVHWMGMFNDVGHDLGAACLALTFCPDPRCHAAAGACDESNRPAK
jgi:hypothetical protein